MIFHGKERAATHTFKEEDEKHPQVEMRGDDEKQDVQPMSWWGPKTELKAEIISFVLTKELSPHM